MNSLIGVLAHRKLFSFFRVADVLLQGHSDGAHLLMDRRRFVEFA